MRHHPHEVRDWTPHERCSARKKWTKKAERDFPGKPTHWVGGVLVFIDTGELVPGVPVIGKK